VVVQGSDGKPALMERFPIWEVKYDLPIAPELDFSTVREELDFYRLVRDIHQAGVAQIMLRQKRA
jgi:hypothetical protein